MSIDDLPPEILLKIFESAKESPPFIVEGFSTLILVSQVSRDWRALALSYTSLWTDIRLSFSAPVVKLDVLLERSRGSPLDISLTHKNSDALLASARELFERLLEHRSRIRALHVLAPIFVLNLLSRTIARKGPDFPLLRRCQVTHNVPPSRNEGEQTVQKAPRCIWSVDCPQVRSLIFTGITPTIRAHFAHLTELDVRDSGVLDAGAAFHPDHFVHLRILSITSSPLPPLPTCPMETQIVSLTLANLRTADNLPDTLAQFLRVLRMPRLEHLSLNGLNGYLWDEVVRWLAQASYPVLRSVVLDSVATAALDALSLRAFSSVSELRLVDADPEPILCILKADPAMCPHLRGIRVEGKEDSFVASCRG